MLEIHNSFNVFIQTLTSTMFVKSEIAVETLVSPKYGKIILKFMWQTKEKHDCLYWVDLWPLNGVKMTWYFACLLLLILFRTNGKKGHLDENDFRHCDGNFFQMWHSESYLITAMFKWSLLNNYDFGKRHWNENRWSCLEKISHAKLQACTWKNIWTKIETTPHLFYALLLLWNPDFLPFFQHLIYRRP